MARSLALATLALLPPLALGVAQAPGRLALIEDWQHQHRHILAVIDSATPAMLGFQTSPGVRTFAQQIYHIDEVAARIVSGAVAGIALPAGLLGDTASTLHDRALLRAQTDRIFTFVLATLQAQTDDQLVVEKTFAGGTMPRWRWNLTALQHSAWTLGQTVPYLRMNQRVPPPFTPF